MLLFNTTEVEKEAKEKEFQNISCYCLTVGNYELSLRNPSFQNISCYCLTHDKRRCERRCMRISKHLMLLFNNNRITSNRFRGRISKHLMLLFNYNGTTVAEQKAPFQNISCYCLTYPRISFSRNFPYFKTSHVIV